MAAQRGPYSTHELHPDVFDDDECDRIIELGRAMPSDIGAVEGDQGMEADPELRAAEIAWIPREPGTEWIHQRLTEVCDDSNSRYGFDLTGFDEELQFTTYGRPGAFYTWHQDGLDGPVSHRKLSLVVQLSPAASYRGADLELFQVVEDDDGRSLTAFRRAARRRGTVVVFPAFEYHRVTPLRRGRRHSLVAWISGPPFR